MAQIGLERFKFASEIVQMLNECTDGVWALSADGFKANSDFISIKTTYTYGLNQDKVMDFSLMVGKIHHSPDGNDFADLLFEYEYGVDVTLVIEKGKVDREWIYDFMSDFLEYYAA